MRPWVEVERMCLESGGRAAMQKLGGLIDCVLRSHHVPWRRLGLVLEYAAGAVQPVHDRVDGMSTA